MMTSHELKVRHALRHLSIRGWANHAGWVDVPAWGTDALDIAEGVRQHCEVGKGEKEGRWRLNDAARRETLAAWSLEEVREALITQSEDDRDQVSHALSTLLGVCPFDLDTATAQQLSDLLAARSWLPQPWELPRALANLSPNQLHPAVAQDDYRTLTQHGLRGRAAIIAQVEEHLRTVDDPTVYMTGKGGSGKSTILSMLRLALQRQSDCIVVHLDFDRPELMMKDSTALDRELIAAVGRAVPDLTDESAHRLDELRQFAAAEVRDRLQSVPQNLRHLRRVVSDSHSTAYATESIGSTAQSLLSVFLERTAMLPGKRLIVLLDTFERVEGAGSMAVSTVAQWLAGLSSMLPSWKIARVLSGRGQHIEQISVSLTVSLDDLDVTDTRELLLSKCCPPKIARRLATLLPIRTPLVVLLAADAIKHSNEEARNNLLQALKMGQVPASMIEGYLYQRILRHLDDPLARMYATASLILPELSLELVFRVLIPATEPDKADDHDYAREVFAALKNVGWLVAQTNSGYLRLREELRTTMLKMLGDSNTGQGLYRALRRRAIAYHVEQGTDWNQAMYFYHQSILTADKRGRVSREILTGVSQNLAYLNDFAADLPRQVAALLSRKADEAVDFDDAIVTLDDSEWQRLMEGDGQKAGKGQYLVDKVDALQALELYRRRPTGSRGNPPTYILQAMCDTARWDDSEFVPHHIVDDFIRTLEPGPKVWREALLRLQWFTRLMMFRQSAGIANSLTVDLGWVLGSILERCSLYGVTIQMADTFAAAEAMYERPFFRKDIFERRSKHSDRSGDELRARSVRLSTWRHWMFRDKHNPLVLPWEICVARPDVMSLLEEHYSYALGDSFVEMQHLVEGAPGAYSTLKGKPWVDFQRYIRGLNDYSPPSDADTPMSEFGGFSFIFTLSVPIGLWPEFYRPLRQIWMEDLCRSKLKLNSLAGIFNAIVPVIPKELSEDYFVETVFREPRIWLFVIAQHADRSGKLLELLDVMIELGLYSGERLTQARDALRNWQQCLRTKNVVMR